MEAVNTNFTVIGLTRLGIKPKSTAPEADALTIRISELVMTESKNSLLLLLKSGAKRVGNWGRYKLQ